MPLEESCGRKWGKQKKASQDHVAKLQDNGAKIAPIAVHFQRSIEQLDDPRTGNCDLSNPFVVVGRYCVEWC